jgi:hypothetical protein
MLPNLSNHEQACGSGATGKQWLLFCFDHIGVVAWMVDMLHQPRGDLTSCDADGDQASQLQHPV